MENKNTTPDVKLYSLQDISKETNTPYSAILKTVYRYRIEGVKIRRVLYFTWDQKRQIIKKRRIKSQEDHARKIKIIEFYFLDKNAEQIARTTKVRESWVLDCLEEFNKYGTVTVESKMNYL
jgi:hypothetical protein